MEYAWFQTLSFMHILGVYVYFHESHDHLARARFSEGTIPHAAIAQNKKSHKAEGVSYITSL